MTQTNRVFTQKNVQEKGTEADEQRVFLERYPPDSPTMIEALGKPENFSKLVLGFEPFEYQRGFLGDDNKRQCVIWARQCLEEDEFVYTPTGILRCGVVKDGDEILGGIARNVRYFDDDIYEVTFSTGIRIKCNKNHPFFMKSGLLKDDGCWRTVEDFSKMKSAYCQFIPSTINGSKYDPRWGRFCGYLNSDGYWADGQSVKFSNNNKSFLNEMTELSKELFSIVPKVYWKNEVCQDLLFTLHHGTNETNPIKKLLDESGMTDDSFGDAQDFDNETLKEFIRGYFNGDGYLALIKAGKKGVKRCELGFSIGCSERRAYEMQFMLWKLGVFSHVKSEWMTKSTRPFFRVCVTSSSILKCLSFLDDTKYPEKFKEATRRMEEVTNHKHVSSDGWIKVRNVKKIGMGRVVAWTTEGNNEIISYCGMRTHNSGKSTTVACKALYKAMRRNQCILILAPTQRQSGLLFQKIQRFIKSSMILLSSVERMTQTMIEFKNGSQIYSLPAGDGSTIRGFSANMIIIDEAGFIKDDVISAITPMLATTDGDIIYIGTPFGRRGVLWDAYNDPSFSKSHCTYEVNPLITKEFVEHERERMTNVEFRQEWLGEFLDSVSSWFPHELLAGDASKGWKGVLRDYELSKVLTKKSEYFLGVDIARQGDDSSYFAVVEKNDKGEMKLAWMEKTEHHSLMDTVGRILNLNEDFHFTKVCTDETGLGSGVADRIKEQKPEYDFEPITMTLANKEIIYKNLRKLMELGNAGLPADNKEMIHQLTEVEYQFTSGGHMTFHHSEEKIHDDIPDALCLAFYAATTARGHSSAFGKIKSTKGLFGEKKKTYGESFLENQNKMRHNTDWSGKTEEMDKKNKERKDLIKHDANLSFVIKALSNGMVMCRTSMRPEKPIHCAGPLCSKEGCSGKKYCLDLCNQYNVGIDEVWKEQKVFEVDE